MAKTLSDAVLDASLKQVSENGNRITVCSQQPTTYAEANATYALAGTALTPGDGNGDFVIANGDTSGRKLTVSQQADINVDSDGTATHIAIMDTVNSALLLVTECASQALTSGNKVTIPAFDYESGDPT